MYWNCRSPSIGLIIKDVITEDSGSGMNLIVTVVPTHHSLVKKNEDKIRN